MVSEKNQFVDVNKKIGWKKIIAFFGPAYLVSVGYVDPGNWATDIAGGSHFGFSLLWVLLMSNIMAIFLQSMAARLGVVRQRDLAQANKEYFSKKVNFLLYILAEIAIIATDLAEIIGMAIGLNLLTGLPIIWGVSLTIIDTFFLLYLQRLGVRKVEAFILSLMGIIGVSFFIQICIAKPEAIDIVEGFVPYIQNSEALYIAVGIIGATIMPHNLYLHSALVQTRRIKKDVYSIKKSLRYNLLDSVVALNLAFLVNAAILIISAVAFFKTGHHYVSDIFDAHKLLEPLLGSGLAPILFAVALIASGQSSTITGTIAGQIVMEGYLNLRINPLLRRILTRSIAIIPTFFVVYFGGMERVNSFLILSQVILSLQLGFAIVPLIHFVSDKKTMGQFALKKIEKYIAWTITIILVGLNVRMIINELATDSEQNLFTPLSIFLYSIFVLFVLFLLYITFYPLLRKKTDIAVDTSISYLHEAKFREFTIDPFVPKTIAIALDFTDNDYKIISYALQQGNKDTTYILIHILESPTSLFLKEQTQDLEAIMDESLLNKYSGYLTSKGYKNKPYLGYVNRRKEIVRIVKKTKSEMLIIGSHGHTALKDFIFGETVNQVRHGLNIPILVVNI